MEGSIIELRNLSVFDDDKQLVKNVSLMIPQGTVIGIVGESGSGKSLTMKALMGILPVQLNYSFKDYLFNQELVSNPAVLPISMIFQDPMTSLNPLQTIGFHLLEVIHRFHKVSKNDAQKMAWDMLEKVGIANPKERMTQYPFEFSGGMRQRVMIAMALLANPKVLIADEPTTALDVTIQMQILSLLYDLQKDLKLTILVVSHDLGVVAGMCDQVVVMYQGQVVESGTVDDIYYDARHPYTKKLLALAQFQEYDQTIYANQEEFLTHVSDTHSFRKEVSHDNVN